jgi:hypothetical protein
MRPIETEYRGVIFRSRMEARWAVFFDQMEIGWVYEQESVSWEHGTYTPDFFLPRFNCFAEVKPVWPTVMELRKMRAAAINGCLLLIGQPDFRDYWLLSLSDEQLVLVDPGTGDRFPDSRMDSVATMEWFSVAYHRAIDASREARFDGYDQDRQTIGKRYQKASPRLKSYTRFECAAKIDSEDYRQVHND